MSDLKSYVPILRNLPVNRILLAVSLLLLSSHMACTKKSLVSTDGSITTTITAKAIKASLKEATPGDAFWQAAHKFSVPLTAQPMVTPRPKVTTTEHITVQAVHDSERLALRLEWRAKEASFGQKVGTFSDAVAVQFPVKPNGAPPPIFMGSKEEPVKIFHWRAMYQLDKDHGFHSMRDIYPNMVSDGYPVDWTHSKTKAIAETAAKLTQEQGDAWTIGQVGGNPQSYRKPNGIDVILAEGYGSSAVTSDANAVASGVFKDNHWAVVITRRLKDDEVELKVGDSTFVAFAVWQGSEKEAGSRKSVTMEWTRLELAK